MASLRLSVPDLSSAERPLPESRVKPLPPRHPLAPVTLSAFALCNLRLFHFVNRS